jgi:uncharacterized protein YcfJ
MHAVLRYVLTVVGWALAAQASAQITLYQHEGFAGRSLTTQRPISDTERRGFHDRVSSVVVRSERWEVCEDARFRGRCVVLRRGQYPSLAAMGLNDGVASVRSVRRNARIDDDRYSPAPPPPVQVGQVTFYEHEGFQGRSFSTAVPVVNFERIGFNDRASSAVVVGERWEVCEDARFDGRCVVLRQGQYPSLAAMGLNDRVSSVRILNADARIDEHHYSPAPPPPVQVGQVTFYEHEGFQGRSFSTAVPVVNFERVGFNDRASSAVVVGERWEVCEDTRFDGRCVVLRQGQYPSLAAMGLNDRVSSVRILNADARIDEHRYSPAPPVAAMHDYRRRDHERLYEANITSVRAVLATSGQRCWVEREQVVQDRSNPNVGGALAGAVIGGILGHQVGGGSGKDAATAVGVLAGAAIGANVGRQPAVAQNVQRCSSAPSDARPEYWDVTYNFRGQEYRVQMTTPPGATVTVNEQGEPRI